MTSGRYPATCGRYTLQTEIARGGMGAVYRALGPGGRPVAIKLLLNPTEGVLRRFVREAQALQQLRHPHVVGILELGRLPNGQPFLAMELVEGESLQRQISREGPLRPADAALLVLKLAGAVQHAHDLGILHRDIKPGNVLLDAHGEPRLTDFGLAKDTDASQSKLTKTGLMLGTPGFWPPEQALGQLDRVDPRSDVYALGATLFAALTGKPPFEGAGLREQLVATIEHSAPAPSSRNDAVDRALDYVVLRCLEKDPDHRYASAADLAADLERYLRGELNPPRRLRRRLSRRARLLAGGATGLGLIAAVTVTALVLVSRERQHAAASGQADAQPDTPTVDVSALFQDAARQLDEGDLAGALTTISQALELDPSHAPALELRGRVHEALDEPDAAFADFQAALALDPNRVEALVGCGRQLMERGDAAEARIALERALELDPEHPGMQTWLGRACLALGDWQRAAEAFTTAIEERGRDPDLTYWRGLAYVSYGRHDDAVRDLTRTIELQPERAEALLARSRALRARFDFEESAQDAEEAIKLGLDTAEAWTARAASSIACAHKGPDYTRAIADVDRALERRPDYVSALLSRGAVYNNLGEFELAVADAERALELNPTSAHAYYVRGYALRHMGYVEEALADLNKALELDELLFPALAARGVVYSDLARPAAANSDYERIKAAEYPTHYHGGGGGLANPLEVHDQAHEELPEDASPADLYQRALVRQQVNHHPSSIEDLDRALEQEPDYAEALALRAWGHLIRLDLKPALADAARVAELRPDRALHLSRLGLIQTLAGDPEAGLKSCERALGLDRTQTKTYSRRARAYLALGREEEAKRDALRAVALERSAEAFDTRAHVWLALGHPDRARADWESAVQSYGRGDPRARRARDQLVELLAPEEPLPRLARPLWRQVKLYSMHLSLQQPFDAETEPTESVYNVAAWHHNHQDYALALPLLDVLLEREPDHLQARSLRAACSLELGDSERALADLERLVASEGEHDAKTWARLARAQMQQDQPERALATCQRALEIDPDGALALTVRAQARLAQDDAAGALEDVQRALSRTNLALSYELRARIWQAEGKSLQAYRDYERALEISLAMSPLAKRCLEAAAELVPEGAPAPAPPDLAWREQPPDTSQTFTAYRDLTCMAPLRLE